MGSKSHDPKVLSQELNYRLTLHGVIMWTSMGFLMPLGILVIRMYGIGRVRENRGTRVKVLFYAHVTLQVLSTLLSTVGAVLSIKSFENSFNNMHQRVGLLLHVAIWVQILIGFSRPRRGRKNRCMWYIIHWILGTAIAIAGIINIYTGLQAYENKTSRGVRLWSILFTAQVSFMALLYLFQDKFDHIEKQAGMVSVEDDEPKQPSDNHERTHTENAEKDLLELIRRIHSRP